jgi:glutathione S-transferase
MIRIALVDWLRSMRLIGRYASPFVRRVAVTMRIYDMPYEHESVMPFGEPEAGVAAVNPLARVPVLVLDDGETLIDSAAILDYLDEVAGPGNSLTPARGATRRIVLHRLAVALGAMEKLVAANYERHFRPKEIWHRPWLARCDAQVREGFRWLDQSFEGHWIAGGRMTQADVTLAVFWSFGRATRPGFFARLECARIEALTDRLEATQAFQSTQREADTLSQSL